MALSTKVGSFTQPTTTNASFGVTGVGFVPKVIILFATDETATATAVGIQHYYGMATSTSNRASICSMISSPTGACVRSQNDVKCFLVNNSSGTNLVLADLVSFDADGFTLNFSLVDAVARNIGYIALGGTDLTNAFIKTFKPAASNTSQAFTGVGFQPTAMIIMSSGTGAAPPSAETGSSDCTIGFCDTALNQYTFMRQNDSESAQAAQILNKSSAGGVFTMGGTLTSFDADGFTINVTASTSVKYSFALCLKGGQYHAGVFNQNTSTGNQSVSGLSFAPTGILLGSINRTTGAGVQNTARHSFGAATSATVRQSFWNGGYGAGTNFDHNRDTAHVLNMITEGVSTTTNTVADFVSLDSTGFTINNTTADATAREISYFAIGSTAVAGATNVNDLLMMFR